MKAGALLIGSAWTALLVMSCSSASNHSGQDAGLDGEPDAFDAGGDPGADLDAADAFDGEGGDADVGDDGGLSDGGDTGGDGDGDGGSTRAFHLGFTPFPYDLTAESALWVYDKLATDADIVAHHFDNGVPWDEALAGQPYHSNLQEDWDLRKLYTPAGKKIYLALTPISIGRDGLAPYRGEQPDTPLEPPWDGYAFDHPDVKAAFVNHCVRAVEFFEPDYLAIGIEVNLLLNNSPDQWDAYVELNRYAYTELKARYPDLPVFASLYATAFLEGWRSEDDHQAQMQALTDVLANSDLFAWALYPYASVYLTNPLPETMFSELFSLSDKPVAIAETGYPADTFDILDGAIVFEGTDEKQHDFVDWMLAECQANGAEFVINFVLRDYDDLCWAVDPVNGCSDDWISWRDTGLYDEDGNPRPSLEVWHAHLNRPMD